MRKFTPYMYMHRHQKILSYPRGRNFETRTTGLCTPADKLRVMSLSYLQSLYHWTDYVLVFWGHFNALHTPLSTVKTFCATNIKVKTRKPFSSIFYFIVPYFRSDWIKKIRKCIFVFFKKFKKGGRGKFVPPIFWKMFRIL